MHAIRISRECVEDARWLPTFIKAATRSTNREGGWPHVTEGMLDVAFHSHSEELDWWLSEHSDLASKTDSQRRGRIIYSRLLDVYEVQRIQHTEEWPKLDKRDRLLFYF